MVSSDSGCWKAEMGREGEDRTSNQYSRMLLHPLRAKLARAMLACVSA